MSFKINDIDLDFDMLDADDNERVTLAVEQAGKAAQTITREQTHEAISEICITIFKCFNTIFGEGTDKQIFGEKTNLRQTLNAFYALIQEKEKQEQEFEKFTADILSKYSPLRVSRKS